MDVNAIWITAFGAGVGAGIGSLIGLAASKRVGKNAGSAVMAAATVIGSSLGGFAGDAYKTQNFRREVLADLSGNELMTLIEEKYPQDFYAYLNKLNARTTHEQATAHGRALGEDIRRREADRIWTTNDQHVVAYISSMRNLTEQIREDAGEEGCYAFIARGELPAKSTERIGAKANRVGVQMMRMLSAGRDEPVARREPSSPQDAQLVIEALKSGGMSETDIAFVRAAPQTFEPGVCEAFISFYREVEAADGEFAQRFRSSFVYNLAQT